MTNRAEATYIKLITLARPVHHVSSNNEETEFLPYSRSTYSVVCIMIGKRLESAIGQKVLFRSSCYCLN